MTIYINGSEDDEDGGNDGHVDDADDDTRHWTACRLSI